MLVFTGHPVGSQSSDTLAATAHPLWSLVIYIQCALGECLQGILSNFCRRYAVMSAQKYYRIRGDVDISEILNHE